MTSTILSLLFLTIGLLLIITWGWKQLPLSVKKFLKDIWAQPFLRRLLKWLVLIIAILAVINWLSNRPKTSSTTNLCSTQRTSLPFNRVNGSVKKINDCEAVVTMNGSECLIDTGLVVKPGESFGVYQILLDNPKQNRITYNFYGDSHPIWGGRSCDSTQIVKYDIDGSVNAVISVLKNCQGELPMVLEQGQINLTAQNPLCQSAKIFLYYNGIREWLENGKWRKDFQGGWDGSTATFRIILY